jgi:hypothetical protein
MSAFHPWQTQVGARGLQALLNLQRGQSSSIARY